MKCGRREFIPAMGMGSGALVLAAALSLSRPELIRTCGYGWGRHAAQWSSEELFVRLRSPDPSAFTT